MYSYKNAGLLAIIATLFTSALPAEDTEKSTSPAIVGKVWVTEVTHPWVPCVKKGRIDADGVRGCFVYIREARNDS